MEETHSFTYFPVLILALILIFSPLITTTTVQRSYALQSHSQGPGQAKNRKVIFHQPTRLCVQPIPLPRSSLEVGRLGPCSNAEEWSYTPQKILAIPGTYFCLQADQIGKPAKLGIIGVSCTDTYSSWTMSDSKMYLSSKLENGGTVCLDVDSNNDVVTNTCKCLSESKCDPGTQSFKIIDET